MHATPSLAQSFFIANAVYRYEFYRCEGNLAEMHRSIPKELTQRDWAACQRRLLPALLEAEQLAVQNLKS